ncbi:MAG: hypothetical protein M1814_002586 [Vezdaea aestivalis]|nr:MAG: hypothetical protein M1814_002586 [Vezdaea aestivalis]
MNASEAFNNHCIRHENSLITSMTPNTGASLESSNSKAIKESPNMDPDANCIPVSLHEAHVSVSDMYPLPSTPKTAEMSKKGSMGPPPLPKWVNRDWIEKSEHTKLREFANGLKQFDKKEEGLQDWVNTWSLRPMQQRHPIKGTYKIRPTTDMEIGCWIARIANETRRARIALVREEREKKERDVETQKKRKRNAASTEEKRATMPDNGPPQKRIKTEGDELGAQQKRKRDYSFDDEKVPVTSADIEPPGKLARTRETREEARRRIVEGVSATPMAQSRVHETLKRWSIQINDSLDSQTKWTKAHVLNMDHRVNQVVTRCNELSEAANVLTKSNEKQVSNMRSGLDQQVMAHNEYVQRELETQERRMSAQCKANEELIETKLAEMKEFYDRQIERMSQDVEERIKEMTRLIEHQGGMRETFSLLRWFRW